MHMQHPKTNVPVICQCARSFATYFLQGACNFCCSEMTQVNCKGGVPSASPRDLYKGTMQKQQCFALPYPVETDDTHSPLKRHRGRANSTSTVRSTQ